MRVFYSFHYKLDCWRAATVRNIGAIKENKPALDNDWEAIRRDGDEIKNWIKRQMKDRICVVVLIGKETANRKWVNYEITEAWRAGLGVVGFRIHGLKNQKSRTTHPGANPFEGITVGAHELSQIVKCYDPFGNNSKERYGWIYRNMADKIEEAINIRRDY